MNENSSKKKIIIIGGGISGLSSGIYGEKNGFETEIFERNPNAGGLCTSWIRRGFPIDGCIHWMTGTHKDTAIYNMWQDVGAFSDDEIIHFDNFGTIEAKDGTKVTFWSDVDKLEQELLKIAPEDKRMIKSVCDKIYLFQNMPLPTDMPVNTMKLIDFIKIGINMIPYLISYLICSNMSVEKFANKFKNPALKEAVYKLIVGNTNIYSTLYVIGTTAVGNGGVPKGGSSALINNMVNTYKELGGKLNIAKEVKEIIVKDGKAVGIRLKNGEEKFADYIIAACDPFHTKTLLNNQYDFKSFEKHSIKSKVYPLPSCVLVSFAIDKDKMDALNITSTFEFNCDEFLVGNTCKNSIRLRCYSYDEHFIQNGKVLVNALLPQFDYDYEFWKSFQDRQDYLKERARIGNDVVDRVIKRFPSLKNSLEIIDIATPKTFNRYTNAFRGAYMPFQLTAKGGMMLHNGKVKGVKNLVLSSQWQVMPGGLPVALMSGKFAIQRILKKEKLNYRISLPLKYRYTK